MLPQPGDGTCCKDFSFGTGDQDILREVEVETKELPVTQDVWERFTAFEPLHKSFKNERFFMI